MFSNVGSSAFAPSLLDYLITECLAHEIHLDLAYSLIEADAVFHNVSVEQTVIRYLIAKLREVSVSQ